MDEPARTPQDGTAPLSPRAREVLRMVAEGRPAAAVAETLGLSMGVVAQELGALRERYGVASTAGAVEEARRAGDLD